MLKVWSEMLETVDASTGLRVFQKAIPTDNVVLDTVRATIVCINDPGFSSVSMKIYSMDSSDNPKKLLYSSTNSYTKAEVMTLTNGIYDIPFEFDSVPLKGGDAYAFVLRITSYTFSSSSFIGWRKDFPDPVYKTNQAFSSVANVGTVSYSIQFIGKNL